MPSSIKEEPYFAPNGNPLHLGGNDVVLKESRCAKIMARSRGLCGGFFGLVIRGPGHLHAVGLCVES